MLIDGQKVGLTPYRKAVGRWDMKDLNVRLEKEGYQSYEVSAQPRLSVGSIIVSILTTGGISMLFLSPQVYQPVTVDLLAAGQSETPQMRAKRLLDSGAITAGEYRKLIATQDQEDRIQELQNLKDRGLLTDQEFQRLTEPKPVP